MRIMLLLICTVTLLASTGCIFWGGHRDDRDHRQDRDEHSSGVDHGEHPGDLDHGDTQQR